MRIRLFQVDAFTRRRFAGNPAAVCPLDGWLEDDRLQAIAAENNLSETAFLVAREGDYELRWFTPEAEVDLCGHATLASAFVVLRFLEASRDAVRFHTRSGPLEVERQGERLVMDFPATPAEPCDAPEELATALGAAPEEVLRATDWLAVFAEAADVAGLDPDMRALKRLGRRGVIVTAPAEGADRATAGAEPATRDDAPPDFVSRFFAPAVGVPEDPVTGSAHCTLTPYWASRLGRANLVGRQISRRGGVVHCELRDGRVVLSGYAVLYLEGWIRV